MNVTNLTEIHKKIDQARREFNIVLDNISILNNTQAEIDVSLLAKSKLQFKSTVAELAELTKGF